MKTTILAWTIIVSGILASGCGSEGSEGSEASRALEASWSFGEGDCSTIGVETVRITASTAGEESLQGEFFCLDGQGPLGQIPEAGGSFSIVAEGLDVDGTVVAVNPELTVTFPSGSSPEPVEIVLEPITSSLVVTWNGCPVSATIPYFIALYELPEGDEEFGPLVMEVQQSCLSARATLTDVPPGEYLLEVDSRTSSPAVRDTKAVTVVAGEEAKAYLGLP